MKIILLILAVLLFSCGPNYHLRKSSSHLRKAILKGAKVSADTTYKVIPFRFPGASYTTVLAPLEGSYIDASDTLRISGGEKGKEVKTKLKITISPHCPDDCIEKIYVKTDCPDVEGEVKTPIAVSNTVVAPRGFWHYLQVIGIPLFLFGFAARHFARVIINFFLKLKPF